MKDRVYKAVLRTLGPVHIGNGSEVSKKVYIMTDRAITVYDAGKLYSIFKKIGRQSEFEQYLLDPTKPNLNQFIRDYRLSAKAGIFSSRWEDDRSWNA